MKVIMFEGTSEEFSATSQALKASFNTSEPIGVHLEESLRVDNGTGRFVTRDEARKILSRLPLSQPLRKLLVKLRLTGDKFTSSDELRRITGYNSDQFRGMMGAFGRRVAKTVGKKVWFFKKDWDAVTGQWTWSLPSSVHEALDGLGIR